MGKHGTWGGRDPEKTENHRFWKMMCQLNRMSGRGYRYEYQHGYSYHTKEDIAIGKANYEARATLTYVHTPSHWCKDWCITRRHEESGYKRFTYDEAVEELKRLIEKRAKQIRDTEEWLKLQGDLP
jgi:hypothetical protein